MTATNDTTANDTTTARPIHAIAQDIVNAWSNVNYAARPYLGAMLTLNSINDNYGWDSAQSIVGYFLANARTFRGARARELKQELRDLLK